MGAVVFRVGRKGGCLRGMGNRVAWDPSRHYSMVRLECGQRSGVQTQMCWGLILSCGAMGLAWHWTFRFTVGSQTSHFRGGYRWEDARKLCFCVYEAGKKHMSFENRCEWVGGKHILLKVTPRVLSKLPGCNSTSSPSIRRMKCQGYFQMIQNVFQGSDVLALYGVPLYRKLKNDF